MPDNTIPNIDPLEVEPMFIDVSWETNDERLNRAVEDIFCPELMEKQTKRSDAIRNFKKHLRAVLIVCVRAHQLKPDIPIACPFNNSFGKPSHRGDFDPMNPKRYNFNKLKEVIKGLARLGYLQIDLGRQGFFSNGFQGRATRFKATNTLKDYIDSHELNSIDFEKVLLNNGMVITYKNDQGFKKVLYDYDDIEMPEDVLDSTLWLPQYNSLIKNSNIILHKQFSNQIIDTNNCTSCRVFHQKRYDYGGRYYGGWWTYCGREDRFYISIDNEQSIECDFKSNHLYLFYGLRGKRMPLFLEDDPYCIPSAQVGQIVHHC